MVLTGVTAVVLAILLVGWIVVLSMAASKLLRSASTAGHSRTAMTLSGLGFSSIAVISALILDLSWLSPGISQRMEPGAMRIIGIFLFWPSVIGLLLCIAGSTRLRFIGIATCLGTGFWWFTLLMGSAIAMGAPSVARHPIQYLIPDGYVGWITIKRGEAANPLLLVRGKYVCRIPPDGALSTSTLNEDGWAKDEYFYYDSKNNLRKLRETGWGEGGMIWGIETQFESTPGRNAPPKRMVERTFIGTETQYNQMVEQAPGLGQH